MVTTLQTKQELTLTHLTLTMEASGAGSEDASDLHPDNPMVINIKLQAIAQSNHRRLMFLRNIRRLQTTVTIPMDTDEAAGAGKPSSFLFYNF